MSRAAGLHLYHPGPTSSNRELFQQVRLYGHLPSITDEPIHVGLSRTSGSRPIVASIRPSASIRVNGGQTMLSATGMDCIRGIIALGSCTCQFAESVTPFPTGPLNAPWPARDCAALLPRVTQVMRTRSLSMLRTSSCS
jgi:hypothetical protein